MRDEQIRIEFSQGEKVQKTGLADLFDTNPSVMKNDTVLTITGRIDPNGAAYGAHGNETIILMTAQQARKCQEIGLETPSFPKQNTWDETERNYWVAVPTTSVTVL